MGKRSKSSSSGEKWGSERHISRLNKKIDKLKKMEQKQEQTTNGSDDEPEEPPSKSKSKSKYKAVKGYHRSMLLSHDNYEKREEGKLRLHISKVKRQIEGKRRRLQAWDDKSELDAHKKQLEEDRKRREREEEEAQPGYKRKRRMRLGPETWKLRGAARPAQEVYDFDTRYVDPHVKAHKDALEKAQRSINAFHVCKGKFGKEVEDNGDKIPFSSLLIQECRAFLALSMQLAQLCLEGKKFKSARETLLEVIDLEGETTLYPITNARCKLMRMYLEANRPDSARRLWEKLPSDYASVWIRYSAALLEFVSWKVLEEKGSDKNSAEKKIVQAIRANVYCAYYIAFHETFHQVMEYTDEVEDAEDGTLEQAIEYCNSEEMGNWLGTEGAVEWVQDIILRTLYSEGRAEDDDDEESESLQKEDLEWEQKLATMEKDFEENNASNQNKGSAEEAEEYEEDEDESGGPNVDLLMFTGMFRTAMDMHLDGLSSQLQKPV
jgi:hypothetical protein